MKAVALIVLLLIGGIAHGSPIAGGISFGGILDPTLNLATTNEVRFGPVIFVTSASDDLDATIDPGNTLSFNNFTFSPFTPNNPLWSLGGFSFLLGEITASTQDAASLILLGKGTMTSVGFDPTLYAFSFSADLTGGSPRLIAFSATNTADVAPVPEPNTLALAGFGIALIFYGRHLKRKLA